MYRVTYIIDLNIQDATASSNDPADYTHPDTATLTFTSGQDYVDAVFTINPDAFIEDLESFTVTLETPVQGIIGVPSTTTVYIIDQTGMC